MIPISFVLVVAAVLFFVARLPAASAQERSHLASQFHFTEQTIALPPGLPEHTIRAVNPQYKQI